MSDEVRHVECSRHGTREATFVCQHLSSIDDVVGFHAGFDEEHPDEPWPNAWCDACERVRAEEGDWNDRSEAFARIQLMCDGCYQAARARHWRQDEAAFEQLIDESTAYLQSRQDRLFASFGLNDYDRYDWDQDTGLVSFSRAGRPGLVAEFQMAGSTSTLSETWLWSWANPSIDERLKHRLRQVRTFGDQHRYLKLSCAKWTAGEVDGWEMTSIAARMLGAAGAYRSPHEHGCSFLLLWNISTIA